MKEKSTFWDRVVEAMRDAGYTAGFQAQAARLVGVAQPSVAGWKAGKHPKPKNLATLARKLHVSTDWLLTGREPKRLQTTGSPQAINADALEEAYRMLEELLVDMAVTPRIEKRIALLKLFYESAMEGQLTRSRAEAMIGLTL